MEKRGTQSAARRTTTMLRRGKKHTATATFMSWANPNFPAEFRTELQCSVCVFDKNVPSFLGKMLRLCADDDVLGLLRRLYFCNVILPYLWTILFV